MTISKMYGTAVKGFYWVIKQPSGFLYANKDIVVYMLESNQVIRTEK